MSLILKQKLFLAKKKGENTITLTLDETRNILDTIKQMDVKLAECMITSLMHYFRSYLEMMNHEYIYDKTSNVLEYETSACILQSRAHAINYVRARKIL